jgi:hypothetical protein
MAHQYFTVTLRAASGRAGIRSLRAFLKAAGRHLDLRTISIRETTNTAPLRRSAARCHQISSAARTTKMDMRKYSGNTFYKVADVKDGPVTEKIAGVVEGRYQKPDLVFESGAKLSINATNNKVLIRAYGADSEDMIGYTIELFLGSIEYQGKDQDAVLVRPISQPDPNAPKKKKKPAEADFDDAVEF